MNFYKRHLGDIAKSCSDLSQGQMGAYDLLLDWLYANEKPLPKAKDKLYRIGRAVSKTERENVDSVLFELFVEAGDGYTHKRAAEEMEKANAKAEKNRESGKLGGRPPKKKTFMDSENNHDGFENETENNPSQTPDSRLQTPEEKDQDIGPTTSDQSEPEKTGSDLLGDGIGGKPPKADPVPVTKIVDLYHEMLPKLPRVAKLTDARAGYIRQRWKQDMPEFGRWRNFFAYVSESNFLMGGANGKEGAPPFRADLEWLCRPSNFAKIAEGKYHR